MERRPEDDPPERTARLIERTGHALVERLRPHVPADLSLGFDGGSVWVIDEHGDRAGCDLAELIEAREDSIPYPEEWEELLRVPLWAVLSHVQDVVTETTMEPWPERSDSSNGDPLPTAEVRRVEGGFRLVYGDPAAPVLELPVLSDEELGIS